MQILCEYLIKCSALQTCIGNCFKFFKPEEGKKVSSKRYIKVIIDDDNSNNNRK